MRKIFVCLISVCALLAISSCSSNESRVKSVFEDYVQSNFDDPNNLVEIASVDSCDTITSKELKSLLKDAKHKYDSIKVEFDKVSNQITSFPHGTISSLGRDNPNFMDACMEYREDMVSCVENDGTLSGLLIGVMGGGADPPIQRYNKVMNSKDNTILQYTIKARIKEDGKVKLKTYYAICDTTLENIKISPKKAAIKDVISSSVAEEMNDLISMYANSYSNYATAVEEGKTIITYIKIHKK